MSVLRNQDYASVSVTLAAGVAQTVTLPRPRTLPALNDNVDHVLNPSSRRDDEAGRAIINLTQFDPATLVRRVEILRDAASPFTEAPEPAGSAAEPLFPSGAPAPALARIAFDDAVGTASNDANLVAFLANLYVGGGESIRLTLFNVGVDGPHDIGIYYDLGRNAADIPLRG